MDRQVRNVRVVSTRVCHDSSLSPPLHTKQRQKTTHYKIIKKNFKKIYRVLGHCLYNQTKKKFSFLLPENEKFDNKTTKRYKTNFELLRVFLRDLCLMFFIGFMMKGFKNSDMILPPYTGKRDYIIL